MGTGLPYLGVFFGNAGKLMMMLMFDDDVDDDDDDDDNRNDNISEIEQDSYGAA